jgi:hypothetical protein
MKFLILAAAIASVAVAVPTRDPYPAPCGRSDPSGVCTTKASCAKQGGFYVQRDCTCKILFIRFLKIDKSLTLLLVYNVLDIGCCYDIPEKKA